jgi:endonuclease/exonuclease/phosphatase (EEP) superfamily protein YafD
VSPDRPGRRAGRRRLRDNPPFTAAGLVWPWLTPWAAGAAQGEAEVIPADAPRFRLVAANALGPNRRPAEFAAAITAVATDVLVVVEASSGILDALEAAEVVRYHRHGLIEKRDRWGGCGIWSRHPMELVEAGDAGHAYIAARVRTPAGPVTVIAVHTIAPAKPGSGPSWEASFGALAEVLDRQEGPLVAAGDYNATLGHRPLVQLLARTGLRDAHTAAGRGLARSWPESRWLPRLGLLDRMLLSDELAVAAIEERPMPGSDHLAIVADLAVTPGELAAPG